MKSKYLYLIFLSKVFAVKNNYQPQQAVPTSGPTPTINTANPDLSEALTYYDCFSIEDSRTCDGMNIYLPDTGVYYSEASSFDKYVNSEVNNDFGILKALCQNSNIKHDVKKIAYRYSVFCGRFAYAQARWCPQNDKSNPNLRANPKLSICKSTCIEYAKSFADYGQTVCGNVDNSIGEKIKENIIKKWCNLFSDDEGCIKGVKKENEQCGYSSAQMAVEAQTFNPHNSCWDNSEQNSEVVDQLKQKATKEQNEAPKMGSIKWEVVYPLSSLAVIAIITFIFWIRQNKQYKLGYIPHSNTKMNEYDIKPSSAEPSREYVDDDFIKKFELEIPKATLNRAGSLSVKKLSISQKDKQKEKKYMIAIYNYHPQKEDELELHSGDRIRVEHEYEDG
ncbi:hypothetical protein BCR36DRAFT_395718 [Piromyces finnis]|uniref:SH3 domain-containing protein n=1 Tax=Piromyces finnis TaxID=1754191 RepID=A0A1Y1VHU4_9FUNG|nr:hypothetical protein BCR36DRAFT_395718 [Piromyces finnis]|eukprot:ORX55954.1 hypothetical protein BCR36DRAFT_395718 [Piromyces finnis]